MDRTTPVIDTTSVQRDLIRLRTRIHRQLLDTMDLNEAKRLGRDKLYEECSRRTEMLIHDLHVPMSAPERDQLVRDVLDEIFGLGPIEELLREPDISDILVNGPNDIYIERGGQLERTDVSFRDEAHLMQVIHRIAADIGRRIDDSSPMLDARLTDGSRVNAVIPPLASMGPL